mmetsp:Transcript_26907/g.46366  ORF Transcript_26907/g.46366 Transcript_26907/m.46366 type:complete len:204 (-) Transcript_26907:346-957(-)
MRRASRTHPSPPLPTQPPHPSPSRRLSASLYGAAPHLNHACDSCNPAPQHACQCLWLRAGAWRGDMCVLRGLYIVLVCAWPPCWRRAARTTCCVYPQVAQCDTWCRAVGTTLRQGGVHCTREQVSVVSRMVLVCCTVCLAQSPRHHAPATAHVTLQLHHALNGRRAGKHAASQYCSTAFSMDVVASLPQRMTQSTCVFMYPAA